MKNMCNNILLVEMSKIEQFISKLKCRNISMDHADRLIIAGIKAIKLLQTNSVLTRETSARWR